MPYILGEVSSPFGAHGRGAHHVRSNLGALFSHSSRFRRQRGARVVDSDANEIPSADQGQLGYILGSGGDNATEWAATGGVGSYAERLLRAAPSPFASAGHSSIPGGRYHVVGGIGEVSSPFGAHGRGAHEVRSFLGEVSSPFGAHGRGAHEVRSFLGGGMFHGLGDFATAHITQEGKAAAKAGSKFSPSYAAALDAWRKLRVAADQERAAVLDPINKQIAAAAKVPIVGPGLVAKLKVTLKSVADGLRPLPAPPERPNDAFVANIATSAAAASTGSGDAPGAGIPPLAIAAAVGLAALLFLRKG